MFTSSGMPVSDSASARRFGDNTAADRLCAAGIRAAGGPALERRWTPPQTSHGIPYPSSTHEFGVSRHQIPSKGSTQGGRGTEFLQKKERANAFGATPEPDDV